MVAAPFIVLLLLGSIYIGRDRMSWFPSSQRRPIPYKQLSKEVIHNGKKESLAKTQCKWVNENEALT